MGPDDLQRSLPISVSVIYLAQNEQFLTLAILPWLFPIIQPQRQCIAPWAVGQLGRALIPGEEQGQQAEGDLAGCLRLS